MGKPGAWAINMSIHAEVDANAVYTNMAAGDSFLFGSARHIQLIDLSGMTQCRLKVNKQGTAGQTSATLRLCYALSYSETVGNYADISDSPCAVTIDVTNTYLDSGWFDMKSEATSGDVYIAVVGNGGNGVLDPAFGAISVAFQ